MQDGEFQDLLPMLTVTGAWSMKGIAAVVSAQSAMSHNLGVGLFNFSL